MFPELAREPIDKPRPKSNGNEAEKQQTNAAAELKNVTMHASRNALDHDVVVNELKLFFASPLVKYIAGGLAFYTILHYYLISPR
jgi:hypothetical protein